jgi:alcohol dehydrogenase
MENFVFQNPTKIIFGKGSETKVGEEIARYGKKFYFIMVAGVSKKLDSMKLSW